MTLLRWAFFLAAFRLASGQPDGFLVPVLNTGPVLNSLRVLPDGTLLYSSASAVARVRGGRVETLLAIPIDGGYCEASFFGGVCIQYAPVVYHPKPMAADSNGAIWIADPEQHLIELYNESARGFVVVAANAGSPTSLAAADDGSLYFNDPSGCRVLLWSGGVIGTVVNCGAELLSVRAIALNADGQLYIADDKAGTVWRVDSGGGIAAAATGLKGPAGIAFDAQGDLIVAEATANRVRLAAAGAKVRTIAGTGVAGHDGDYGPAFYATLTSPTCLAMAPTGELNICDTDRIRRILPPAPGRWVFPTPFELWRSSPGALISVLGDFGPVTKDNVTADVEGRPCTVTYASTDRIDLMLPATLDTGWQPFGLNLPGGRTVSQILIFQSTAEFLTQIVNGKLYPVGFTPDQPADPRQTITLYVTGLNITGPTVPNYNSMQPPWMNIVLGSLGYPVSLSRPVSPGIFEVTFTVPAHQPRGEVRLSIVSDGYFSVMPVVLPVK